MHCRNNNLNHHHHSQEEKKKIKKTIKCFVSSSNQILLNSYFIWWAFPQFIPNMNEFKSTSRTLRKWKPNSAALELRNPTLSRKLDEAVDFGAEGSTLLRFGGLDEWRGGEIEGCSSFCKDGEALLRECRFRLPLLVLRFPSPAIVRIESSTARFVSPGRPRSPEPPLKNTPPPHLDGARRRRWRFS